VNGLNRVASLKDREVAEKMTEAALEKHANRFFGRHVRRKRGGRRADWFMRLARQQFRALGLAENGRRQGERIHERKTKLEQRRGLSGLELELDFINRLPHHSTAHAILASLLANATTTTLGSARLSTALAHWPSGISRLAAGQRRSRAVDTAGMISISAADRKL